MSRKSEKLTNESGKRIVVYSEYENKLTDISWEKYWLKWSMINKMWKEWWKKLKIIHSKMKIEQLRSQ